MYGYMFLNKKFYELGEIKLCGGENSGYEWTYGLPSYIDLSDHEARRRNNRYWRMSTKEGEVYKCRTVWLAKDDSEKAKDLIKKALKDRCDKEIEAATLKYKNALSCLN